MFPAYQQPTNLPVSLESLQYQPLQITPQNPPFVPQLAIDPRLVDYLPLVSAMAAREITDHAVQQPPRPLRVMMFNLYAANNFANELFVQLIAATMDYINLAMSQQMYPLLDQAVQDCTPKLVEMTCGWLVSQFPAAEAYLDQNTRHHAAQMADLYRTTMMGIERFKQQRMQQPPMGYQNNPGMQQWRGGAPALNPGAYASGVPSTLGSGGGAPYRPGGVGTWGSRPSGATGSVFNNSSAPATAIASDPLRQPFMARAPAPVAAEPVAAPPAATLGADTVEFIVKSSWDSQIKWTPQKDVPYFPAYNPVLHELLYRIYPDGHIEPQLKNRSPVDYDRHEVPSVFGPAPAQLDLSQTADQLEALARGVERINQDSKLLPKETEGDTSTVEFSSVIKKAWLADTSLAAAWLRVSLESMKSGETPDLYRAYASIAETVVSDKDESSQLQSFASSLTFIELREKLNATINEVSPGLWGLVDRLMTAMVNRMIYQNLSLPGLKIESFAADIVDLLEVLKKNHGNGVRDAFLKEQRTRIWNTLAPMEPNTLSGLVDEFLDPSDYPEGKQPSVTAIASHFSLTYLNCRAHELNIELNPHGSAVVTEEITPVMAELLRGLFEDGEDRGIVARYLLRTTDGRVLEATRGLLGKDFMLLTLIE